MKKAIPPLPGLLCACAGGKAELREKLEDRPACEKEPAAIYPTEYLPAIAAHKKIDLHGTDGRRTVWRR